MSTHAGSHSIMAIHDTHYSYFLFIHFVLVPVIAISAKINVCLRVWLTQLYYSSINAPKTIKFDLLMVVSFSCESTHSTILVSLNISYSFDTCGLFIDTTQLTLLKLINFISLMVGCFSECYVGNHDNESRKILFFIYNPNCRMRRFTRKRNYHEKIKFNSFRSVNWGIIKLC
jgi:NADH:ubiquinone oxidoreductase subunit 5 (subunit L)/multisubunit Na+/H+ antiporter MnhA subunit